MSLEIDEEFEDENELTPEEIEEIRTRIIEKSFEPKPYNLKATKKIISVCDSETDPFEHGLVVQPFTIGFYTADNYIDFWGDDCVQQFFNFLDAELKAGREYIIYAHNGGKFDFFFFLEFLDQNQTPLIIAGRLVKVYFGGQEFRDSYSIIPMPLSGYQKDEIDYQLFTRDKRETNKELILSYQKSDCEYTFELITGFHDMFGDKLTVASASFSMLHSYHGFQSFKNDAMDERFRKYYYGGRNQCFETGVLKGNWKLYDRNSMYPTEMRDTLHPISNTFTLQTDIDDNTDFACIDAWNDNCLPTRAADGGLDFTQRRGTFWATIHEIKAGLETGTLIIHEVKHAWAFDRKANFDEFVTRFYNLRLDSKKLNDKIRDILYKFCLNSPYGKFAMNPRKFKQWTFTIDETPEPLVSPENPNGWSLHSQSGPLFIWCRPNPRKNGFYNVATAASITGAARANLHRNLALSKRPIYCDTDSILCEEFHGELDPTELGGWDLEATGTKAAIGGKKLYALFDEKSPIKKASKGVRLEAQEILRVCNGDVIEHQNPVPNFKLDGSAQFVTRKVRKTGSV